MRVFLIGFICIFSGSMIGQSMTDFTVTDSGGQQHKLYEDYLDQGKVVVMKVFFINCPPCRAVAPAFQAQYEAYGEGSGDVQFLDITNKTGDMNSEVATYKTQLGLTMPGIGSDGGALNAIAPLLNGTFGTFFGTPHFSVIAPDGTVNYDVSINDLSDAIDAALQNGGGNNNPPSIISLDLDFPGSSLPDDVFVMMKPRNAQGPIYNLTTLTNSTYEFEYPSQAIPQMEEPVIYLDSRAPARNTLVQASDITAVRKHILLLDVFDDEAKVLAADVNGDGKVRASDLVEIRKVILQFNDDFPNGVKSYIMNPGIIDIEPVDGETVNVPVQIIKMGNVN